MKILLLNPPSRRVAEKKDIPPYQHIGLGYLASSVAKEGYDTEVIDAKLDRLGSKETVERIAEYSPDVLGITSMTHEIVTAADIVRKYKNINPGVKVVLGGVHVSAMPEATLEAYPHIDVGVIGEGEIILPLVLKSFETGSGDLSSIGGIVFRDGSSVKRTDNNKWIEDLDTLPQPAWECFPNAKDYIVITSRGCPYSCVFCMQASGKKVRNRSIENVVGEIEEVLEGKHPRRFLFYDETFTLDKKRVLGICDLMIEKGLDKKIKWSVTTRVDAVDRDILVKMKQAGCDHIEFGVESGNEEMLQRIKKGITKAQAERAISLAKEMGYHTEGAFILGHPHENMTTALETIDFAAKLNPDIVQLGIMVPYPGTEVREMVMNNRGGYKMLSDNWAEYNKQLGNAVELEELSRSDLERLQLAGYLRLFIYNKRYLQFIKFIFRFWREMVSYLRNILRRREKQGKSNISYFQVIRLVFRRSIINEEG